MPVKVTLTRGGAILENGHVHLELSREDGRLTERIAAWDRGWKLVLASLGPRGDPRLDLAPVFRAIRVLRRSAAEAVLRLEGTQGIHRFTVDITLAAEARHLHYRVQDELGRGTVLRSLQSRYAFAEDRVDFCFTPHLRPKKDQVIGQFAFKSPAVIVQREAKLAAIVPDLALLGKAHPMLACLEADVSPHSGDRPMLGYGFKDHEPYGLIYFRHRPDMTRRLPQGRLVYGYHLYVSATAEAGYGYREIVRLLWEMYGRLNAQSCIPQVIPFDRYAEYGLGYALPTLWRELPRQGQACGGIIMGIKFPNDIWFHFFFNHLHTAYGLYLLGRRWKDDDLIEKARKIRNLILTAPTREGLVPAIFSHEIITGLRHDRWIPHAHWVGGAIPYQTQIARPEDFPAYNTMDSSWTCYWMLRWYTELERDPRLLSAPRAYGNHLLRIQLPSGAIPVFLHAETLEPEDRLRESPSCAGSGLFLAQLYAVTRDARYLRAAERVAAFLAGQVMPQGWTDYESYYDSAGKPMDLVDQHTQQRPQNTFGMYWTAELCKLLFRLTKKEEYCQQALRALDYLLLFQAIWNPPYLSVKGFGSIGIGNGHTGWNDARSGIFAPGIADFYFLTGNAEYLQRGTAAMRAPLALMYIPENRKVSSVYDKGPLGYADECYGHRGQDARLGPSCFDFSVGYALVAFNELWARLGSAYVDLETGRGFGVDGCVVKQVALSGTNVTLRIEDQVARGRVLQLRMGKVPQATLTISVNGKRARTYRAVDLQRGIDVKV